MTVELQDRFTQQTSEFWKGKRVLVTGGTKGLGKALTLNLISLGATVTVVARSEDDLRELQKQSNDIYIIPADVSEKEDIHRISGQATGMMEGIDVLFNNASTLGVTPLQPLIDTDCETFEEVLQTNLLGPFRLIKAVLPIMKFHGKGLVVNISSDAAQQNYATWGPYSISKSALDHLTAIWSEENSDDIDFVSLDPGDMNTQMHLDAIPDANPEELYEPEEVAKDLLEFLASTKYPEVRYGADEWRSEL